ncbi:MAG: carbamoyltransferase N-terminal domain-containing protein, partial [Rickettsiella sp.]|nr:carbamoyltransferase N-terminal domain-containing protein [Rickettsiella sp.]
MNILGYSGLHGAINFRKSFYNNFTEQEYRMCQGLDSAACIMVGDQLIAAVEEERFNGEKYTCNFPINAVNYCLQKAGLTLSDLDYICHGFNYQPYYSLFLTTQGSRLYYQKVLDPRLQIDLWKNYFPKSIINDKLISIDHHLAHAATAYYP